MGVPAVPPRGFSSVWSTKHGETHLRNCANQPLIVRRHFLEAERLKKLELKLAITPGGVEGDITNPDLLEGGSVLIKRKAKDRYALRYCVTLKRASVPSAIPATICRQSGLF